MQGVPELEAAIVRDPDDLELRRVYADALQEAGDPRGEHIALAFAAEAGDRAAAARVRERERELTRALIKRLDVRFVVRLTWKLGFVDRVDIDNREQDFKFPANKLRELLARPELRALRALDLRGVGKAQKRFPLAEIPKLVADVPLRWLGIGDGRIDGAAIDGLLAALPRLTGLGLLTRDPEDAILALGRHRLRDVELGTRKLTSAALLARIFAALSPELERLVLYGIDDTLEVAALAPILARDAFPQLRDFGILGPYELTYALCRRLVKTPLLPQLRSFGFCAAGMYDEDVSQDWFIEHKRDFAHVALFTSDVWPDEDNGHESGRLGLILKDLGRSAEAVPECEHHLAFSGTEMPHAGCWEELAEALVWAGRAEDALPALDRGLQMFGDAITENSAATWRTRAEALDALGRFDEAIRVCERLLDYQKKHPWTLRYYGFALHQTGRFDDALRAYDKAIEYVDDDEEDPDNQLGWAHLLRGRLLWDMERLDDAVAALERAAAVKDTEVVNGAWATLGHIARQQGKLVRARKAYRKAVAAAGSPDADPAFLLGEVLAEAGELDEALAVWRAAAAGEWEDIDEQGFALVLAGRPQDALAALDAGKIESPGSAAARSNAQRSGGAIDLGGARACALAALGRYDEAIGQLADYGRRGRIWDSPCAYRHVAGLLLQGLFHRAAGRADDAAELLELARPGLRDPAKLHAQIVRGFAEPAPNCGELRCGRGAAVVALAAACALGDRDDARRRARAIGAAVDGGFRSSWIARLYEVHAILPLLGEDRALVATVARTVERCTAGTIGAS